MSEQYTNVFSSCEVMDMYLFKRDFVQDVVSAINASVPVTVLIGPRKCGKTVCLNQIKSMCMNTIYYDVKRLSEDERITLKDKICESIRNNENIVYLVDEVTYWMYPDSVIMLFSDVYAETLNTKTKIVLAGSQSRALECWCHRAFAGNANFIRMSFMDYSEWLRYTNSTPSASSYNDFLFTIDKFYNMSSLQDYLQACLDETVISNAKTSDIVLNNDCDLIDVNLLLDVLYVVLISRHNHINTKTFTDEDILRSDIKFFFHDIFSADIAERIEYFLMKRYCTLKNRSLREIRQAMQFLYNCGLVTITYMVTDPNQEVDAWSMLFKDSHFEQNIQTKTDLFHKFNFSIRHPMFYVAVLKLLLQDDMPVELPHDLLGSLVECHVRGLMPEAYSCEYHDAEDNEVDYLNQSYGIAIEVTVSNKKLSNTHFDCVEDCPIKILSTRDQLDKCGPIYKIPYYTLIEYISRRYTGNPYLDRLIASLFNR